jgi:hypothetical protein
MIDGYHWTGHGHWYGLPARPDADAYEARPRVANCGGPQGGVCRACATEAGYTLRDVVEVLDVRRPQVCDTVLYRSYGTPKGEYTPQERAAIVTETDGLWVGLVVLNPTGMFFRSLADGGCHFSPRAEGGTWRWPL